MSRLFPRLVELEKTHGSVTRGMLRAPGPDGPMFLSLAAGMGRLIDRLSEQLPAESVRTGCQALAVSSSAGGGYDVRLGSGETVRCRALVVALPLPAARALLESVAADLSRELGRIPMVSTAVVFHGFRRADVTHPLDGYGFLVPAGESNRLLAATFVTTKLPHRAQEGRVLFRTFLGGTKDPAAYALSDSELVELSRRELSAALGPMGEPLFSRLARWERRTPQVELGHTAIVTAVERELVRARGLYVLANGLGGVGIPDSVHNAKSAASDLIHYLEDQRL